MSAAISPIVSSPKDRSMTARSLTARSLPTDAAANWDAVQFKLIFALCFLFYLPAAIGARLTPRYWRTASPHRSIFADACKASGTMAQIAFHG
jgi:hypothetical protein